LADIFDTLALEARLDYKATNKHPLKPHDVGFTGFIGVVQQLEPGKGSLFAVPIPYNF
jgi:hypothetical protein